VPVGPSTLTTTDALARVSWTVPAGKGAAVALAAACDAAGCRELSPRPRVDPDLSIPPRPGAVTAGR
jgi:hypothetical protein